MTTATKPTITIGTTINAPVEKVWAYYNTPEHIVNWNNASDDWHTPSSKNDLKVGGRFVHHMAAKDGSFSFDFSGTYEKVEANKLLEYVLDDTRRVTATFEKQGNETVVTTVFEAEGTHSLEMQEAGWQAILNNFKKYVEAH